MLLRRAQLGDITSPAPGFKSHAKHRTHTSQEEMCFPQVLQSQEWTSSGSSKTLHAQTTVLSPHITQSQNGLGWEKP